MADQEPAYGLSWRLILIGALVAMAVTITLLILGAGFGLMVVNPVTKSGPSAPAFFTGGAIYFAAVLAFAYAIAGYVMGRLLGMPVADRASEEFRAAAHGFGAWAVSLLATLVLSALLGLAAAGVGTGLISLYGFGKSDNKDRTPSAYIVDTLFRPASGSGVSPAADNGDNGPHAEATRIVDAGLVRGEELSADDRDRLAALTAREAGMSRNDAMTRVMRTESDVREKTNQAANVVRKTALYGSLWLALSFLFSAVVSVFATIHYRDQFWRRTA